MNNFYKKNKFNRLLSLILMLCLIVTSIVPTYADSNGKGAPGNYSPPPGGGYIGNGNTIKDTMGGYRFSLLFLSGNIEGTSILDSVGNVNIEAWKDYYDKVKVVGSLDVYYPGKDNPSYKSYGDPFNDGISSFFMFDKQGINRASKTLSGSQRNMIDSATLKLSAFPWHYNCDIGPSDINSILAVPDGTETVKLDLYPGNPPIESQKYKLTEDCVKIITELCKQSGLSEDEIVGCETARESEANNKNVFEKGTYNGDVGSYRLMIEPYEILNNAPAKAGGFSCNLKLRSG